MKTLLTIFLLCAYYGCYAQEITPSDTSRTISPSFQQHAVNFNAPLYILDNKEISEHEMRAIQADKIKSITILKDSTATARFGERGRRGVVIIEMTKATPPSRNRKRSTN